MHTFSVVRALFVSSLLLCFFSASAQDIQLGSDEYALTVKKMVAATPVKSQGKTGTCWSFATSSFIESEALRQNKGTHDVSEMYFVRYNYPDKARHFIRMHGNANFGQGSLSHDVTRIAAKHGIVPEMVYSGLHPDSTRHDHSLMFRQLDVLVDSIAKTRSHLPSNWIQDFENILEDNLGEVPNEFEYQGTTYNATTFASEVLGFDASNYIQFTSYVHHPFFEEIVLEIPDNWANGRYYNVPIDDLESIMDNALDNGFSIAWDGDVSEKSFSHKNGLAIIPQKDWSEMNEAEKANLFKEYQPEKKITQELRQETFDNYKTTDDHLMHIVGSVIDESGTKYYVTKNSWGDKSNGFGGYLYLSQAYNRLKCVAIMVHKDAIPKNLKKKLAMK